MLFCVGVYPYHFLLQFNNMSEYGDLLEGVDKSQLTPELGGYLEYVHEDWVKFRMVSRDM